MQSMDTIEAVAIIRIGVIAVELDVVLEPPHCVQLTIRNQLVFAVQTCSRSGGYL